MRGILFLLFWCFQTVVGDELEISFFGQHQDVVVSGNEYTLVLRGASHVPSENSISLVKRDGSLHYLYRPSAGIDQELLVMSQGSDPRRSRLKESDIVPNGLFRWTVRNREPLDQECILEFSSKNSSAVSRPFRVIMPSKSRRQRRRPRILPRDTLEDQSAPMTVAIIGSVMAVVIICSCIWIRRDKRKKKMKALEQKLKSKEDAEAAAENPLLAHGHRNEMDGAAVPWVEMETKANAIEMPGGQGVSELPPGSRTDAGEICELPTRPGTAKSLLKGGYMELPKEDEEMGRRSSQGSLTPLNITASQNGARDEDAIEVIGSTTVPKAVIRGTSLGLDGVNAYSSVFG
ncbi:hypothetical protein K402DRAFT_392997 [Aulographum hederae CBS 113979]|uniref:Uncharacterized protein n=1 Tax=Aulographum hederae CBS 113979 TaxID=1176131 RepID=A0A6G1H2L5_9PEZI|nr:hypothetical protein K402DRAFT_392997 [Aulographum hederae CBS 113979]